MELYNDRIGKYYLVRPTDKQLAEMNQYKMAQEILNATGINIVTCGDCGQVMLHRITDEDLKCQECGFDGEPCDFPDLFY